MSTIISFLRKMNKLRLRRNAGIGFISSRAFVLRPYEVLTPWLICSFALGCQLFIIRAWWIRKILVNWKSYSTCFLDYFLTGEEFLLSLSTPLPTMSSSPALSPSFSRKQFFIVTLFLLLRELVLGRYCLWFRILEHWFISYFLGLCFIRTN